MRLVANLRHACCGRQPALPPEPHPSDAGADDLTNVCLEQQRQQAMHEQTRCADRDQHALSFARVLWWNGSLGKRGTLQLHAANCASVVALATRRKTCRDLTLVHRTIKCITNAVPWYLVPVPNHGVSKLRDETRCAASYACVASHIALGMRTGARVSTSTRVTHSCTVTESDCKQHAVFIRH